MSYITGDWDEWEINYLKEKYGYLPAGTIAADLYRSIPAVVAMAKKLGVYSRAEKLERS